MSAVKHGAAMYPCIRRLVMKHGIRELKVGARRVAQHMDQQFQSFETHYCEYNTLTNNGKRREARAKLAESVSFLDRSSLSRHGGLLSPLQRTHSQWCNDRFSIFTVEPLHLPHLGMSKKLKECTAGYLSVLETEVVLALSKMRR